MVVCEVLHLVLEIWVFGCSSPEKHVKESAFANQSTQLNKPEKRNESEKYQDTFREEVIDAHVAKRCSHLPSVQEVFDQFLNHVKAEHQ